MGGLESQAPSIYGGNMKTKYERELEETLYIALDCLDRIATTYTSNSVYRDMAKASSKRILKLAKNMINEKKSPEQRLRT